MNKPLRLGCLVSTVAVVGGCSSADTTGGGERTVAVFTGNGQVEGEFLPVPIAPAVRVTDDGGLGVAGVAVTFTVTSGGGQLVGASQTTNAEGTAAVGSWTLGPAGPQGLTATAEGLEGNPVAFAATALRLSVAAVSVSGQPQVPPGASFLFSATARDSVGRVLSGRQFTWTSSADAVATVNQSGTVTGVQPGFAAISATSEGKTGSVLVTVSTPTLPLRSSGLTGHMGANLNNAQAPPAGFGYGLGYYSSVHPVVATHAASAQFGWGTWLMPDNLAFNSPLCPVGTVARDNWPERGPSYRDVYQTIEGGAGIWVTTRFPASMSKFRINATPDCYNTQIGSPAWHFYGTLLPNQKLGLAQLSNRLLVPPDGFVFAQAGQAYFGNAWIALPLIDAYTSPSGVPTGGQSWTLFARATNYSGAVAFYTPETWSLVHAVDPTGVGRGHDARPMFSGSVAIEMGNVPYFQGTGPDGTRYRRIPRLVFPVDANGRSVLIQDVRFFAKGAIWDAVRNWIDHGTVATTINAGGTMSPSLAGAHAANLRFDDAPIALGGLFAGGAVATTSGAPGFGFQWSGGLEAGTYPEYFRETGGSWVPIPASGVPRTTWLVDQVFPALSRSSFPGVNQSPGSPWEPARWAAGPFTAMLADGSAVDYVWYRFVDQPAIARLGLGASQLDKLQQFAASLHEHWGVAGPSLAMPSSGTLATLDPAQIVTPPAGLEKGYVPIVIRQR